MNPIPILDKRLIYFNYKIVKYLEDLNKPKCASIY